MCKVKELLTSLGKWEYSGLCLLVLVMLALHLSTIVQPNFLIFDESWYVPDARHILQGEGTTIKGYPPLGKLFIVSGILLFGDNAFGWRFFSVLFGTICTILFYLICRQLNMSKVSSFFATFLLSTENLSFVQASVAMLDVYSLTFMLASFWLYLKGRYVTAGVIVGLATLAKLSGALALPVMVLHWLFTRRQHPWQFLTSILITAASFLLLMPLFDFAIWHRLLNPIEQTATMLGFLKSSTFARYAGGELLSRPWDWIMHLETVPYTMRPSYVWMISPTIWALIVPTVLFITFKSIRRNSAALFALFWFAGTYLVWIPISLVTDRTSYVYYFYPTVGAVCMGIAQGTACLSNVGGKVQVALTGLVLGYLLLSLYVFVILAPGSPWYKVPCCVAFYAIAFHYLARKRPAQFSKHRPLD